MQVLVLRADLHLPVAQSLKAKRSALKPVLEGARRRFDISVAETDHQNTWQRSTIGMVVVSGTARHAEEVIDEVESSPVSDSFAGWPRAQRSAMVWIGESALTAMP